MRLLPMMTMPLLLGGCMMAGAPEQEGADLARELAGRSAGPARQCVSITGSGSGSSLQAVDRRTLVYRQGPTTWVNRVAEGCADFHPNDTLIVEVHGSEYCRHDLVRSLTPGTSIAGPACPLGDFVPYRR